MNCSMIRRWSARSVVGVLTLTVLSGCRGLMESPKPPEELRGGVYEGLVTCFAPSGNPLGGFYLKLTFSETDYSVVVEERPLILDNISPIGSRRYGEPTGQLGTPQIYTCSYRTSSEGGYVVDSPKYQFGIHLGKAEDDKLAYVAKCFLGQFMHLGRVKRVENDAPEPNN